MNESDFLDTENRVVGTQANGTSERVVEEKLRPQSFKDYVGQRKVVENISVMVESAKLRRAPMDHVLLSGPPGLGKTSLAMIMAHELGVQLHVISGPAIEKKGDIAAVLTNLGQGDILFIDEIHRLHISIEEILYSAMEDFRLDIVIGQGAAARTMQINLPAFCLIGATTRSGLLSNPLRDRFQAHLHFDFYEENDLKQIILNNAPKLGINLENEAVSEIARRARGTPRIANRVLRRVRDFAVVEGLKSISASNVSKPLAMLEIDSLGLDRMDRKILKIIRDIYSNGPVGIEALCATLGEDRGTIEEVYEPYLLKEGLLIRTPRGRAITERAAQHLASVP